MFTFVPVLLELAVRYAIKHYFFEDAYSIIWCVTAVTMAMLLLWGQRAALGVFVGGLLAFLCWYPPLLSLVYALDGVVQVSLGVWLMRRFWPQWMPIQPSVRFFAIMIGVGCMLPVFVCSLPTVFVHWQEFHIQTGFWNKYIEWCVSELSGVLILLPVLLLLFYPSFSKTLERRLELGVYIFVGLVFMVGSVLIGLRGGNDEIMSMEGWLLVGTMGFMMIVRNGVGGVIIANLAMAIALIGVQLFLTSQEFYWITHRMQVEFNIYSCHLTSMTLIVAAGFYDHKMLHNASRGITARMLGVQVAERRKLAADLHDSVSQEFAAGLMHLRTGVMQIPDAGKNTSIRLAEQALSKGLQDLRHMAVGLRPELLEHSAFADVIEAYCETIEARYNIDVLFVDDIAKGVPRLSLEKREHLFRIVQESLGNAVTHGKAKTITVTIASKEKRKLFTLTIEDDGEGFDQSVDLDMSDRPHLGLRLMQERALVISGQFLITSRRGRGTTVSVSVPFDDAADTGVVGRDA